MPRRIPSGPLPEVEIRLSANQRRQLAETIRCRTTPQRSVERARIVLLASRGERNAAIARHLHLAITTVRLWRRRFAEDPEHGLEDRPRPGRPRLYSNLDRASVIAFACELPARHGLPLSRFSHSDIAREIARELRPRAEPFHDRSMVARRFLAPLAVSLLEVPPRSLLPRAGRTGDRPLSPPMGGSPPPLERASPFGRREDLHPSAPTDALDGAALSRSLDPGRTRIGSGGRRSPTSPPSTSPVGRYSATSPRRTQRSRSNGSSTR